MQTDRLIAKNLNAIFTTPKIVWKFRIPLFRKVGKMCALSVSWDTMLRDICNPSFNKYQTKAYERKEFWKVLFLILYTLQIQFFGKFRYRTRQIKGSPTIQNFLFWPSDCHIKKPTLNCVLAWLLREAATNQERPLLVQVW